MTQYHLPEQSKQAIKVKRAEAIIALINANVLIEKDKSLAINKAIELLDLRARVR